MITIATAGKGGTGKTTILAGYLTRHLLTSSGRRVLVVDADPHQCLTTLLAERYALTPALPLGDLRRENEMRLRYGEDLGGASRSDLAASLVERALTPLPNGHHLLTMGASDSPGCQCVVNSLLGRALDALAGQYDLVVMDNEAGIEPVGRHAWAIDLLLLTASPRALDLDIALRILEHASLVGREVRRTFLAINFSKPNTPLGALARALNGRLGTKIHLLSTLPEMRGEKDAEWLKALDALALYCGEWIQYVSAMVSRA